jgi:hypothetical protein
MKRRHAAAAVIFVVLSVLMTWPLARNMERALAFPGDPFLNVWILDWVHYATMHRLPLFHAPAFYPARYALAFSENLYGIALALIPFRLAGASPITAYNLGILGGFAFSGFGAYLLAHRMTGSFAGGLAAGVFYAFVPFRFTQVSHIQHTWGGWVPVLLLALLWYVDGPSWRRAIVFGAAFVVNGLTNIHWFFFGSFAVAATAAMFFAAGVRRWRELLAATGGGLLVLAPFLYPYFAAARLYGMTRSWTEVMIFSARLSDWLVATDQNYLYRGLRDATINPERWLFPGALAIALSIAGAIFFRRSPRAVAIGLLWIVIGVVGSLGLHTFFHSFLFDAVPGFKAVRVPARWAAIAYVGMAILIALVTATLERKRVWLAALVPLALLVELRAAPMRWYMTLIEPSPVYGWLARQPLGGAVLELPVGVGASDFDYLLRWPVHRKKLVNGTSGFVPPHLVHLKEMFTSATIGPAFTEELRRIGVQLVIVHVDWLGAHEGPAREWIRSEIEKGRMRLLRRFDHGVNGAWVFELRGGPSSPLLQPFLEGRRALNEDTFGLMDAPGEMRGAGWFTGYALSPHGIRSVDLLFSNGAVRVRATLVEDRKLNEAFPGYPCPLPRFVASLPERPPGVREVTDVQAEIIDERGKRTRLDNHWFNWYR